MGVEKRINNTTYNVPVNGENRWGERMTRIILALIDTISNLSGPEDIITREALLSNNAPSPLVINGLKFDTSIVQNIRVDGVIVRTFSAISGKSPTQDTFVIDATTYDGQVEYNIRYVGSDAKVKITLENNGQAYYTSEDIEDTTSIFTKFYGKAIIDNQGT